MKKAMLIAAAMGVFAVGCTGIQAPKGYSKLLWHDEFDGNTLDSAKWSRIPPRTKGKAPDWLLYTSLRSDLAKVENGCLVSAE